MSLSRYFVNIEDRVPATFVTVYGRGCMVNGAQTAVTTVTVHAGFDLAASDKFLYAETPTNVKTDRIFTVSSVTASSVTFSGLAHSFADASLLVPLGTDSVGIASGNPNWDGSGVTIYEDPAGTLAATNSTVSVFPGGEAGFWGTGAPLWLVAHTAAGRPTRVYLDVGGVSYNTQVTSLPSASLERAGTVVLLQGGTGVADKRYWCGKLADDTYDWFEVP